MLTIEATAMLDLPRPFSNDELGDLIAAVIDDLDERVLDPEVGTTRTGEGVRVRVSMTIPTDAWEAQQVALSALRAAFDTAVPEVAARPLAFTAA
jgi:hypothetical protein